MSELFWNVVPLLACMILFVGLVAVWWSRRPQSPRLGQKLTDDEVRRIKLLVGFDVELEIRGLLKQAIDRGIEINKLTKFEGLLQKIYMNPSIYSPRKTNLPHLIV